MQPTQSNENISDAIPVASPKEKKQINKQTNQPRKEDPNKKPIPLKILAQTVERISERPGWPNQIPTQRSTVSSNGQNQRGEAESEKEQVGKHLSHSNFQKFTGQGSSKQEAVSLYWTILDGFFIHEPIQLLFELT